MTNQPDQGLTVAPEGAPDSYLSNYDGFEKDWLSTSALACLMTCGIKFQFRYLNRMPEPITVRQGAGLGVHKGRQVNLQAWKASGDYLDINTVKDSARDDVNDRFSKHDYAATNEFQDLSKKNAAGLTVDLAVEMVAVDYSEFQIELQPESVEESIAVQFPGLSRVIVGTIDNREPDCAIVDLKTGKRAWGEDKVRTAMGLTTYGMLVFAKYGILPPRYTIQNVVRAKTSCKTNVYHGSRTLEDLERQLARFLRACEIIDAGNFMPCSPEDWHCSPEWCGYWSMCEFGGAK